MTEHWEKHFAARAAAYWTEDRTRAFVGNRRPAFLPGEAPMLLRALGLMHRDGSIPPTQMRKYRQINHMIAVLQPTLKALRDRFGTVRLVDAACGRSYISTLVAWHFRHRFGHPVQILGIDWSPALVQESQRRAALIGLDDILRFETGSLRDVALDTAWETAFGQKPPSTLPFHGVLSLHGCDTATDDAIALGLRHRMPMIAVVPCCQAELAAKWAALPTPVTPPDTAPPSAAPSNPMAPHAFLPLFESPHLRRSLAAHVTDLFRVLLLRAAGYETSAIEFVPSEHTPKNTLIRALRPKDGAPGGDPDAWAAYLRLREATGGAGIGLESRLPDPSGNPPPAAVPSSPAADPGPRQKTAEAHDILPAKIPI